VPLPLAGHRRVITPPGQGTPAVIADLATATIRRCRILGGLINEYDQPSLKDHPQSQDAAAQRLGAILERLRFAPGRPRITRDNAERTVNEYCGCKGNQA